MTSEWLPEHELLSGLFEIQANQGRKRKKRLPRPKPAAVEQTRIKQSAVDRMIGFARQFGGGK